jgi:hypothetical protein
MGEKGEQEKVCRFSSFPFGAHPTHRRFHSFPSNAERRRLQSRYARLHVQMSSSTNSSTLFLFLIEGELSCLLAKQNRGDGCKRGNLPSPVGIQPSPARNDGVDWKKRGRVPMSGRREKCPAISLLIEHGSNISLLLVRKKHFSI